MVVRGRVPGTGVSSPKMRLAFRSRAMFLRSGLARSPSAEQHVSLSTCVVAHHNQSLRLELSERLRAECSVEHVRLAGRGDAALQLLEDEPADVLLVGTSLSGPDSFELIMQARKRWPATSTLLLTRTGDERAARRAFAAGANGVINLTGDDLVLAFDALHSGRAFVAPDDVREMLRELRRPALSPRERQVLLLISDGYPTSVVSDELGVSYETTKTHISKILQKLSARSRTHAVAIALRAGIID